MVDQLLYYAAVLRYIECDYWPLELFYSALGQ